MFPREEQMSGQSAKRIPLGEAVAKVVCIILCSHLFFSTLACYVTMAWFNVK